MERSIWSSCPWLILRKENIGITKPPYTKWCQSTDLDITTIVLRKGHSDKCCSQLGNSSGDLREERFKKRKQQPNGLPFVDTPRTSENHAHQPQFYPSHT